MSKLGKAECQSISLAFSCHSFVSIYIFYGGEIGFILQFGCISVCHSLHRPSYTHSQLCTKFEGQHVFVLPVSS